LPGLRVYHGAPGTGPAEPVLPGFLVFLPRFRGRL